MKSPFPGMDPYLENPGLWPGVHNSIIYCLRSALNQLLPESYVANIEERLYVSETERRIVPDVTIKGRPQAGAVASSRGVSALLERVSAPERLVVWDEPQRETYIEVRETGGESRVITVIELLSYVNKSADSDGRGLYLQKQREVLNSPVHLLEIDLLRSGRHTASAPLGPMELKFNRWDYLICLSLGFNRHVYDVWPLSLRRRLPRIMVPLKAEGEGVPVDLQGVLDRAYEEGAYERNIDYELPPAIPLRREDRLWADRQLRGKKG